MKNPFAEGPFVSPSTNRVRIVDLPGVPLPDEVKGKTAAELLSAAALRAHIGRHAARLALAPDSPSLLEEFEHCFTAVSPRTYDLAEQLACDYGRYLGYVLLALKRGDDVNRAARSEWGEAHWAYWGAVNTVWLGGGLVMGHLGAIAAPCAQAVLHGAGYTDYRVRLSPYAADLPLLGAARHAPATQGAVLLFDFGHSWVKRACAIYDHSGAVLRLVRLRRFPTPCRDFIEGDTSPASLYRQARQMVTMLADTWIEARQSSLSPDPVLIVSLACYLRQGHPPPSETGCYGRLQLLAGNLQSHLSTRLGVQLGQPVMVRLVHDATAAASVYAGAANTVVLMLGTAIGTGFPPPGLGLRPLRPQVEFLS